MFYPGEAPRGTKAGGHITRRHCAGLESDQVAAVGAAVDGAEQAAYIEAWTRLSCQKIRWIIMGGGQGVQQAGLFSYPGVSIQLDIGATRVSKVFSDS